MNTITLPGRIGRAKPSLESELRIEIDEGCQVICPGLTVKIMHAEVLLKGLAIGKIEALLLKSDDPRSSNQLAEDCQWALGDLDKIVRGIFCQRGHIDDVFKGQPIAILERITFFGDHLKNYLPTALHLLIWQYAESHATIYYDADEHSDESAIITNCLSGNFDISLAPGSYSYCQFSTACR